MKNDQNHGKYNDNHKDFLALSKPNDSFHAAESQNQYDLETEKSIRQELLRRSEYSYNIHAFAVIASIVIGLIGCVLLLGGRTTEGTFTTAAGLGATAYLAQTGKESQESLNALVERLNDSQYDD